MLIVNGKIVQARQIAEEFLAPKVVDDEDDEESPGFTQSRVDSESHEGPSAANPTEVAAEETPVATAAQLTTESMEQTTTAEEITTTAAAEGGAASTIGAPATCATPITGSEKKEERKDSEAEREAVAAAHNMALLPDEPLDRLSGIIGTAMQHGKTVVYSVIRSAARQPNGDLIIPVVGGSMANGFDARGEGKCSSFPFFPIINLFG